jgi:pyoverdine/dityrosine biosynthesis protein Dit1
MRSIIEHKLTTSQINTVEHERKYFSVNLVTWSLTKEQSMYLMQRIASLIEEAEHIEHWE